MIAVIGSARESVRIVIKPPQNKEQQERIGQPVEPVSSDDTIILKNSGCGFNIAIHLASMGHETGLITVVGDDTLGVAMKAELEKAGVNVDGVKTVSGASAMNVEFLNILGDVQDMYKSGSVVKDITPELVQENDDMIRSSEAIVIDGSIPEDTIKYIADEYGDSIRIFFDPASIEGGKKAAAVLENLYCVTPGRMEAEAMTGKTVLSEEQLMEAGAFFTEKGVDRTIITIKGGGLYYQEGINSGILRPKRVLSFGNTTGTGDIVTAAVVSGTVAGRDMETVAKEAMDKAAEHLADVKDEKLG